MKNRNHPVFDKFIVRSKDELTSLNAAHPLIGAYMITGDTRHVSIHSFFYLAQKLKHTLKQDINRNNVDFNLCHNMICIGWDAAKERPILSHVVKDGLKINTTCYFTYHDNDVDYMEVFIPKESTLKSELAHSAEQTAAISALGQNRSRFSWGDLLCAAFKNPMTTNDTGLKRNIAATMADLFSNQPLRESDGEKLQGFHCAQYAFRIVQVSMILQALSDESRLTYSVKYSALDRDTAIDNLLEEMNDASTTLGVAYAESQLNEINSAHIGPGDVSYLLTRLSDLHDPFFAQPTLKPELQHDMEPTEATPLLFNL